MLEPEVEETLSDLRKTVFRRNGERRIKGHLWQSGTSQISISGNRCGRRPPVASQGRREPALPNSKEITMWLGVSRRIRSVRYAGAHPASLGELITADHQILKGENKSRNDHRNALIIQDVCSYWIQFYPTRSKGSTETESRVRRIMAPSQKPGRINTDCFQTFMKTVSKSGHTIPTLFIAQKPRNQRNGGKSCSKSK